MYRKPRDFSSDKLPFSPNASHASLTIEEPIRHPSPPESSADTHHDDVKESLLPAPASAHTLSSSQGHRWLLPVVSLLALFAFLWTRQNGPEIGFTPDNPDILNVKEWSSAIAANRQLYQSNSSLTVETNATLVQAADPESIPSFHLLSQHNYNLTSTIRSLFERHLSPETCTRAACALLHPLAADPHLLTFMQFPADFETNMPMRAPLIRLHRDLIRLAHAHRVQFKHAARPDMLWQLANKLESALYPWLPRPLLSLLLSPNASTDAHHTAWTRPPHNSHGLVYPVGRKYARHVILSLLSIHKLSVRDRIEMSHAVIVYAGEADLPRRYRDRIVAELVGGGWREASTRLAFVDVASMFVGGMAEVRRVGVAGWAIKPFALLFSPFQHSLLVDADTLFLAHPFPLLTTSDPGYLATGTTFFHDRTLFPIPPLDRLARNAVYPYIHWLHSWHPTGIVGKHVRQLRAWRGVSEHEMESGVVAVDKARVGVVLGLVAACGLNAGKVRDEQTYTVMHGDKESYWLAFELVSEPFAFLPGYGGTIGTSLDIAPGFTCGALLHTDRTGRVPLWLNGGLEVDKHAPKEDQKVLNMSQWMPDLNARGVEFRFGDGVVPEGMFCMRKRGAGAAREVAVEVRQLVHELGKVWSGMYARWGKGVWEGTDSVGIEFDRAMTERVA